MFEVTERIGEVAYRLKLPADAKIHDVFNVSLLKPFKGDNSEMSTPIPNSFAPICGVRTSDIEGEQVQQVLIQWTGQRLDDATWENWGEFKKNFPSFYIEDKVFVEAAMSDRTIYNS